MIHIIGVCSFSDEQSTLATQTSTSHDTEKATSSPEVTVILFGTLLLSCIVIVPVVLYMYKRSKSQAKSSTSSQQKLVTNSKLNFNFDSSTTTTADTLADVSSLATEVSGEIG